jgi:lipoprotein-anchoring transpeptidase ErfK/SrfK
MSGTIDRRACLAAGAGALFAARPAGAQPFFDPMEIYAGRADRFPVQPIDLRRIGPAFYRTRVQVRFRHAPGTLVIDPRARYLYHLRGGGEATRFGVGVGRQGFAWSGEAVIRFKREWPDWYPPEEMIDRQPELERQLRQLQSGWGVPGGPRNPLGARALYLWQGNQDTLYRIHGTPEPWTIGRSVSSGCIRMINQDVIDLFDEIPVGTTVVVLR